MRSSVFPLAALLTVLGLGVAFTATPATAAKTAVDDCCVCCPECCEKCCLGCADYGSGCDDCCPVCCLLGCCDQCALGGQDCCPAEAKAKPVVAEKACTPAGKCCGK